jgi:hypothetical protein
VRILSALPTFVVWFRAPHQFHSFNFGGVLAQFVDSEGAHCSVGAEAA